MDPRKLEVALAGLLHDIGKIEQRSLEDPWNLPQGNGVEGQPVHVKWSEYFIANFIPTQYRPAALNGVYHHQPDLSASDLSLSRLIALADILSAGERSDVIDEGKKPPLPQQMVSIFDRVGAFRENNSKEQHYLPLTNLSLSESAIFPTGPLSKNAARQSYQTLRDAIRKTASAEIADPETYLENLMAGFQRYAWSVPSAVYNSVPDVSLYDHSRMTAALAVCLDDFQDETLVQLLSAAQTAFGHKEVKQTQDVLNQPVALLVGGDISGIQKFLYTLSARHAAKTLRGRSFFLQLLTEAILRFILREIAIPVSNVIYSGGGHFYFLAPLSTEEKLKNIQSEVSRILLKHLGTGLYVAFGWTQVSADGFKLGKFPEYWGQMHRNLSHAKQHRYQELGEDLYALVFEPAPDGGNQENSCSVCGEEKPHTERLDDAEDETPGRICNLCQSFDLEIGRRLPDAVAAFLTFGPAQEREPGTAADILAEFGMGLQFYNGRGDLLADGSVLPGATRGVIWALDDLQKWPDTGRLPAAHTMRYTVNRVPDMTFDELQEKSNGIKRLGVLRMDVDDLGMLFQTGFGKPGSSIATVTRLSTLSSQMSLFFEGWIKRICEELQTVYTVYSGGDDLFLVAPWDIIPDLANQIQSDFSSYTSHNPSLHISAGMAFIHGKYPIYQAAEDAYNSLESAKGCEGKQAFNFLGQTWKWTEFEALREKFNRLVWIDTELKGARSLLQLLQKLARMEADQARIKNRPVWGPWMWLGDYQFRRIIESQKSNPDLQNALEEIYKALSPLYQNINAWGIAARWTQIYVRKSPKEFTSISIADTKQGGE